MQQNLGWVAGLVAAAAVVGASFAAEPTFNLFTASEAAAWNATQPGESKDFGTHDLSEDGDAPSCRSTPDNEADNPQIRILAPALGRMLTAPIDIDLQFVPTASAPIRPDTFRVCYVGLLTMDITKRITDHVSVSRTGLHVTGAMLPHGRHRLVMLIADERGRLGRREAVLDID